MIKRAISVSVFVVALLVANTAKAAVLELTDTSGTVISVPAGFDFSSDLLSVSDGDPIWIFGPGTTEGLALTDGPATLRFEYIGGETEFIDTFSLGSEELFSTAATVPGTSGAVIERFVDSGLIPFIFHTNGGDLSGQNGGPIESGVLIAFGRVGHPDSPDGSFLALFDDGSGTPDYDGMVIRISTVPVPAAIWLFVSAILGLIPFCRVRRDHATNPEKY